MKLLCALCACLWLFLSGCHRGAMPDDAMWSGAAELAEGRLLPFQFNLDLKSTPPRGYFLVGDEKTPIPEIAIDGQTLIFRFSEYGAEMTGNWNGSAWEGKYMRHRSDGTTSFNFTAAPVRRVAPPLANPPAGPIGKYQVQFQDEQRSTTLATLWAAGHSLYGTFIAPDGDYGLFAGGPADGGVELNRFTGWQALAMVLEQRGGTWAGKLYTRNEPPRLFTLEPRADLEFRPPPDLQAKMKNPDAPFVFEGLGIDGTTVRNTDDGLKSKALIVDIMGTWCHNCLDGAPVLQQLKEEYGPQGLEIVGLSFEISDDAELGRKNLRLYRDRFGLTFPLLFAGSLDEENVEKRLNTQLDNFFAYPTTLFIDKNGKVQSIHSGFKGPGTGDEFKRQVEEFHRLAQRLVE